MDFGLAEFERRLPEAEEVLAHAVDILAIGARAEALMDSIGHIWLRIMCDSAARMLPAE